jgi:Virulence protein
MLKKEQKINIKKKLNDQIVLYKNRFEVRINEDTIWLNLNQITELFGKDKSVISRHLKNIFEEKELSQKSTVAKFATVQMEGDRTIKRDIEFYNLDVIISVGYRVNSKKGTQFRIWATKVLKKHIIDGYSINEKKLKATEQKYLELKKVVGLLGNIISLEDISDEIKGLVTVISHYSNALDILDDYDHKKLSSPEGITTLKYELTYKDAINIISEMSKSFKSSSLFGREKDEGFKSSLGALYQTFNSNDVYPTVQEKAANLIYFVTKNHSFIDGNKRIAAALFIYFLQRNDILLKKDGMPYIDNNALVALTLMIAASKPFASEKDSIIKVILNLLA